MQRDSLGKAMAVFGWLAIILAALLIYALTSDLK